MKHYLSVFMLVLIVACVSCTNNPKPDGPTTRAEDECPPLDTAKYAENISLKHAAELISNFLNHRKFGGLGKTRAIGGTFPLDQFYSFTGNVTPQEGALLWFCYNDPDFDNPAFFLSVEPRANLATYPNRPDSESLTIPAHTFRYEETDTRPEAVEEYLFKQPQKVGQTARRMRVDTVGRYAREFTTRISATECRYPFSFFNNDTITVDTIKIPNGLQAFLTQVPSRMKHVRYYFGYDPHQADNKIRIILFGVDSRGYNICQYVFMDKKGCKAVAPAIILQKSIPPQ